MSFSFQDQVLNILMIVFPQTSGQKKKEEQRKQILAAARGAFEYIKHAPRYLCLAKSMGFLRHFILIFNVIA